MWNKTRDERFENSNQKTKQANLVENLTNRMGCVEDRWFGFEDKLELDHSIEENNENF